MDFHARAVLTPNQTFLIPLPHKPQPRQAGIFREDSILSTTPLKPRYLACIIPNSHTLLITPRHTPTVILGLSHGLLVTCNGSIGNSELLSLTSRVEPDYPPPRSTFTATTQKQMQLYVVFTGETAPSLIAQLLGIPPLFLCPCRRHMFFTYPFLFLTSNQTKSPPLLTELCLSSFKEWLALFSVSEI